MKKVLLVSHAAAQNKRVDFWGFWDHLDFPKAGDQIEELRNKIAKIGKPIIWKTSPLLRARQTMYYLRFWEKSTDMIHFDNASDHFGPFAGNVPTYEWHIIEMLKNMPTKEVFSTCWSDYFLKTFSREYNADGKWVLNGIKNIFDELKDGEIGLAISHNPLIQAAVYRLTEKKLGDIPNCAIVEFTGENSPETAKLL